MSESNRLLKERLRAGETAVGTWLRIPHPVVMEVVGRSGFDFVHIDMEHGPIGTGELDHLLLAARASNIPAVVRVPGQEGTMIGRTLDMGAAGVIVPQVNTGEEAERVIKAARFHPQGLRGLGGACRADQYGGISFQKFAASANEDTMLAVQIESKEAVDHLDDILNAAQQSVDVFFIGPADLSQSLGVPGQFTAPVLWETIRSVVKQIRSRGYTVGIHTPDARLIKELTEMGIQYVTYSFDIGFLAEGAKEAVRKVRRFP